MPRTTRPQVIVATGVVALTVVIATVATALVVLTTELHVASNIVRDSISSLKITEDTEASLLIYDRMHDERARTEIEHQLRRKLIQARPHVTTPSEELALDRAGTTIERYFGVVRALPSSATATARAAALGAALDAVRKLREVNEAQTVTAQRDLDRWDSLGTLIGVSTGVFMATVLGGLVWWLRRAVVVPLFELADTMERFGKGELDARAPPRGATELRDMATRFNLMADALARQHREQLRYLAGIAHDLRNPLGALQLSTEVIDPDLPLPPEPQLRQTLAVTRRQVTRLNRMVSDLLETVHIEAGVLALQPRLDDIRDVVTEVGKLFEGTSAIHQIRVEVPPTPLVVLHDALRIEQTLTNLVSNAIKYSPHGGEVRIVAQEEADEVVIRVTDHGIGMSEAEREHIWEPFRRTGTSSEMIAGVGLGLSTARRIVDAHGGTISVTSVPGAGSTFTVRLPRHAELPRAEVRPRP